MTMVYIAACVVILALLLQFAVQRAPDVKDTQDIVSARRVRMVGFAIMAYYLIGRAVAGEVESLLPILGLLLISLAEIAFCLKRLFPQFVEHLHLHQPPPV